MTTDEGGTEWSEGGMSGEQGRLTDGILDAGSHDCDDSIVSRARSHYEVVRCDCRRKRRNERLLSEWRLGDTLSVATVWRAAETA